MEGLSNHEVVRLKSSGVSLDDAAQQVWDVVVVGTGVGGATFGYAMASAGRRVLFVERGRGPWESSDTIVGTYPEAGARHARVDGDPATRELLVRGGRDTGHLVDSSGRRPRSFVPFIGVGAGGSSALYGMAMERFFPCDFDPGGRHREADSALPPAWPLRYEDLAPWYGRAEGLYRVRGTVDPLRTPFDGPRELPPPPALTPQNAGVHDLLQRRGLHPYRLPMACEYVPDCQSCQGFLCPRRCKNDATRVAVEPALLDHGARWLGQCRVQRLVADRRRVQSIVCRDSAGAEREVRGRLVALAAGAMRTPSLLLNSTSAEWPQGLANESGLVGRHLMRHAIDLLALDLGEDFDNRHKQLACNDFYDHPRLGKLGSIQSFGRLPPVPVMYAALEDDVRHIAGGLAVAGLGLVAPLVRKTMRSIESQSLLLALTIEDLPYAGNGVLPGGDGDAVPFRYQLHRYERRRLSVFRGAARDVLQGYRTRVLSQAENNQRIAHACGTCRFGIDPRTSVLDVDCRAHGLENLLVVDASFFPSSGGVNPSLTIAANALRVAGRLCA